ncbi:GvpL/GvpF family gas vesicle protein [Virgibacillus necropolis]|uniref:Gas vesicle protein GvpL n=1 Tax=Virgibacillus necropolis TaxID=163877 RepID=A0A221M8W7_9BACI|nr:GvpL/GvpF family gas vesicle protein [Virgibacillus necropolis]ASN04094.1 gas vesicle protein GvpL [Virgibacillus necropolis]
METLIYLYGFIRANEMGNHPLPSLKGIDNEHAIYPISIGDVEAVVCDVDKKEYNEKVLEEKIEQVDWVREKAFHHHEMMMQLHETYTIIPMKFCTIYKNTASLMDKIDELKEQLAVSLDYLADKEEWNLKIYCDNGILRESISKHNLTIDEKRKEIASLSPGRQYLEKKKLDQVIDQEADKEKESFSSGIHDELKQFSVNNEVKKNWNKDVTGRTEEMCWNSVYLLPLTDVEAFLSKLKKLEEEWKASGWSLELTGPWPSYHFANLN